VKNKNKKTKKSKKLETIESESIDLNINKMNLQNQVSKLKKEVHRLKIE